MEKLGEMGLPYTIIFPNGSRKEYLQDTKTGVAEFSYHYDLGCIPIGIRYTPDNKRPKKVVAVFGQEIPSIRWFIQNGYLEELQAAQDGNLVRSDRNQKTLKQYAALVLLRGSMLGGMEVPQYVRQWLPNKT